MSGDDGQKQQGQRRHMWGVAAVCLLLALALSACGGGQAEDNPDTIIEKATGAIRREGMAFHARGDDGSEVWIDAEGQRYRARRREGTSLLTAVGAGWQETTYDPQTNTVSTRDSKPASPLRIDDPMVLWFEPLSALAYGAEITDLGETTADGKQVIAVEARTPIGSPDQPTSRFLIGRVELDPSTYLVHAFERRVQLPPGETPDPGSIANQLGMQNVRIRYDVAEFVPLADLPADFFDKSQVEEQIITIEKSVAKLKEAGTTAYWLGERYADGPSVLVLPAPQDAVQVDETAAVGSFHYGLEVPGVGVTANAVIVRLAPPGRVDFPQPSFPQFAGRLPENVKEVTVRGQPAALGVSLLTPAALPCPNQDCPPTDAPLFIRLQIQLEGAAVQIETYARVDNSGVDQNGYNTESGITQLAEALAPAQ